jgi:two-component system chemotaxis response regulator CheY
LASDHQCPGAAAIDDGSASADNWSYLIVDDNPAALATLRTLIMMIGLEPPLEASGGQEAMDLVRSFDLDCIITDLRMEPMNGIDFIRWVRGSNEARTASIKILAISAYRDAAEIAGVEDAGANGFLSKPLTVRSLRRAIALLQAPTGDFVDISATPGPSAKITGSGR